MSMLPLSGLATALGLGFQGYGQDQATLIQRQRQQVLDQQAAQKFGLDQQLGQQKIDDTAAQAAQRTSAVTRQQLEDDTVNQYGVAAANGDKDATMKIVATFGTRAPMMMQQLREYTKPPVPHQHYDADRGGMVNEDTNTFTPTAALPPNPNQQPIMGSPAWKAAKQFEAGLAPQPLVTTQDPDNPDGAGILTPRTAAAGQHVPGKPKPGAAGAGSLSADDRGKMLAQANVDNTTMKRIEQRVLDGQLNFGTIAGLAGAASGAHGSPTAEATGVLGNAVAGAIDPDIQNYFTAQQSYGRIMGNLQSKRYTDHQADIERRISGMQGNDLANTIQYKQQLRDASLADPSVVPGAQAGGPPLTGGSRGGTPQRTARPTLSTTERVRAATDSGFAAWLKAQGITP